MRIKVDRIFFANKVNAFVLLRDEGSRAEQMFLKENEMEKRRTTRNFG